MQSFGSTSTTSTLTGLEGCTPVQVSRVQGELSGGSHGGGCTEKELDQAHSSRALGLRCTTWGTSMYPSYLVHNRLLIIRHRGYLESCKAIVTAARTIAERIRTEIPELRILGNPRASVVAFASARKGTAAEGVSVLEVGDMMAKKGWHLNGLSAPAAVHIAVTRLTVPVVDQFIADLKDSVKEARLTPSGAGTMVRLYGEVSFRVCNRCIADCAGVGLGSGSPIGSRMVGHLATAFLDTLYKA